MAQQLLSLRASGISSGLRLAWLTEDLIAVSAGSTVYVASIQLAGSDDTQVGPPISARQTTCCIMSLPSFHAPVFVNQRTASTANLPALNTQ